MANWHYYNENKEKVGPVTGNELKQLVQQKTVTPETFVEAPNGRIGLAKDVKGLVLAETIPETLSPPELKPFVTVPSLSHDDTQNSKSKYFYTGLDGRKRGPVSKQELQTLTVLGIIGPNTPLTTNNGQEGVAWQISDLFAAGKLFCTNCGNPVTEQAIACMSCGAKPIGHKKFCRHCGVALNPEQVVCIKCGAGISTTGVSTKGTSRSVDGDTATGTKNKIVAGLFGIVPLFGVFGVHMFYVGKWGWGLVFLAISLSCFGLSILTIPLTVIFPPFALLSFPLILPIPVLVIIGIIQGIMFLVMSDEDFAAKYSSKA